MDILPRAGICTLMDKREAFKESDYAILDAGNRITLKPSSSDDVFVGSELGVITVEMPCFSCDEPVEVMLPFYGCVYCAECMVSEGYGVADAPEFKTTVNSHTVISK